ncbi:MAG: hypothetical protein VB111_06960 [Clostridiaceae bacterium]|nr:hypothetical protein [Clostridiaceae bacterium]
MLKIGFAEGNITPTGRVSLHGQYNIRVSEKPADELLAVGMAIGTGRDNFFWAACDLCAIVDELVEDVLALLKDSLPISRENLVLSATHIHTGPYLKDELSSLNGNHMIPEDATSADDCRKAVAYGIAHALRNAYADRRECVVETAVARIRTGVSRRIHYTNEKTVMYGQVTRPDFVRSESRDGGPVELAYVREQATGKLYGVIADVPCTAQVVESKDYITPDYFGVTRREIKAALGDVKVLGLVSAAGDLSPHVLLGRYPEEPNDREEDGREELGKRVAKAILEHREKTLTRYDGADYAQSYRRVRLPLWQSTKEERDAAQAWLSELRAKYGDDLNYEKMVSQGFRDTFRFSKALAEVKRYRDTQEYFEIDVHAVRIGKMALITNPFELYVEYADRIRAAMRGVQLFDAELAGDCPGYLATARGVRGEGYSATIFSGQTSPAGGEILVRESIEMLQKLF